MNGNDFEYTDYYNGVEAAYSNNGDYYETDYLTESIDDGGYYEAAEAPSQASGAGGEEVRRFRRRPVRPGIPSSALNRLQSQLNSLRNQVNHMRRKGSAGHLGGKLKQLEDRFDKMKQSQLMNTLLGYPKLESIQFEGEKDAKKIADTEYEIPLLQLLLDQDGGIFGGKGGQSNQLTQLLIFSELSNAGGRSLGGQSQLLPLLLLMNNCNK